MPEQEVMSTLKELMAESKRLRLMGKCPACKKAGPFQFKDGLSAREFQISGLCPPCQDEILREELE